MSSEKKSSSNTNQYTEHRVRVIDGPFIYRIFYNDFGEVEAVCRDYRDHRPSCIIPETEWPEKVKEEIDNHFLER